MLLLVGSAPLWWWGSSPAQRNGGRGKSLSPLSRYARHLPLIRGVVPSPTRVPQRFRFCVGEALGPPASSAPGALVENTQAQKLNRTNSNFPPKAAPNAKPSAAGFRWRGGARKRAQFSPLVGNGDKRTLRRRRAQWDGGRGLDPPLRSARKGVCLCIGAGPRPAAGGLWPLTSSVTLRVTPSPKGEGRGMGLPKPSPLGEGAPEGGG